MKYLVVIVVGAAIVAFIGWSYNSQLLATITSGFVGAATAVALIELYEHDKPFDR